MFNHKGSTLIESLLAFEIFITILTLFVTLFASLYQQENKLQKLYQKISEKEVDISFQDDYQNLIQQALH